MMTIKEATSADFEAAFDYIEKLWDYNSYDKDATRVLYEKVLADAHSFAFFLVDDEGAYHGFCHGVFFDTFWLAGPTCYVSSLITNEGERGRGYGTALMNHAKALAEARGCKGMVLDSGLPRTQAHQFYEHYGFNKSCYGFDLLLDD